MSDEQLFVEVVLTAEVKALQWEDVMQQVDALSEDQLGVWAEQVFPDVDADEIAVTTGVVGEAYRRQGLALYAKNMMSTYLEYIIDRDIARENMSPYLKERTRFIPDPDPLYVDKVIAGRSYRVLVEMGAALVFILKKADILGEVTDGD